MGFINLSEWSLLSIYLDCIRQIKLYQTVFMKKRTENLPSSFWTLAERAWRQPAALFLSRFCLIVANLITICSISRYQPCVLKEINKYCCLPLAFITLAQILPKLNLSSFWKLIDCIMLLSILFQFSINVRSSCEIVAQNKLQLIWCWKKKLYNMKGFASVYIEFLNSYMMKRSNV